MLRGTETGTLKSLNPSRYTTWLDGCDFGGMLFDHSLALPENKKRRFGHFLLASKPCLIPYCCGGVMMNDDCFFFT
jgi:hypothetical protein